MDDDRRSPVWGFADGSLSVSGSMLLAVLINYCQSCNGIWLIGFLKELTDKSAGLIVVATLLLLSTAVLVYGGIRMFFAAKEAFERKQRKLREAAREEARQEERERIGQALDREGITITPELARILEGAPENRS